MKARPVHEQSEGDRRRDGGRLGAENGGGLMEGAPPLHREVRDGNVGRAQDAHHGRGARAAIGLVDHPVEQEIAEVDEEEHGGGGEPRIPRPPRAPTSACLQMEPEAMVMPVKITPGSASRRGRAGPQLRSSGEESSRRCR